MGDKKILGILPNQYVHVLDLVSPNTHLPLHCTHASLPSPQNTNITVLEVGPQNLILQDNHKLVAGPLPFVIIPPGHYTVIINPIDKRYTHTTSMPSKIIQ